MCKRASRCDKAPVVPVAATLISLASVMFAAATYIVFFVFFSVAFKGSLQQAGYWIALH